MIKFVVVIKKPHQIIANKKFMFYIMANILRNCTQSEASFMANVIRSFKAVNVTLIEANFLIVATNIFARTLIKQGFSFLFFAM